jgi:hypothetical protein
LNQIIGQGLIKRMKSLICPEAQSARALSLKGLTSDQMSSGTILIAPQGHSETQMPQPLQ